MRNKIFNLLIDLFWFSIIIIFGVYFGWVFAQALNLLPHQ